MEPDRLARFRREAQVLAALNHPNIAAIYGFEEGTVVGAGPPSPKASASRPGGALVLELIEGPTLADRIAEGPLPWDEALSIAKQIADALGAAHEHGIVHRDLKPANIKVREDGTVKVLDFGLAKALERETASGDASKSPTVTAAATQLGVVLGTAAYMAPEQARGNPVDRRADIWAFGCVLYEMLAGKRAFDGDSVSDTMAAILRAEPDWRALAAVPAPARLLLMRCLEKNPRKRVAEISTARFVLDEGASLAATPGASPNVAPSLWRRAAGASAIAVAGALTAGSAVWVATRADVPVVERFTIGPQGTAAITFGAGDRDLALAPDGATLFYLANNRTRLLSRPFDQLEPNPLVTVTGDELRGPFVSPDGLWVGFATARDLKLHKVPAAGGPAILIAQMNGPLRGATWLPSGDIVFATTGGGGLQRVSSDGGEVTVLTTPDGASGEADHLYPERLPAGQSVLFTISAVAGGAEASHIAVLDLSTRTTRTVLQGGSHAHYVDPGYLVYTAGQSLRAVRFDSSALEMRGTPVPVISRLANTPEGAGQFAVAANGTLVYGDTSGSDSFLLRNLIWIDRQGAEEPVPIPPRAYFYPRLSPDGSRVVLFSADDEQDLWLWDFGDRSLTRLTFDSAIDHYPVWTPDGRRIIFGSRRSEGVPEIYEQQADGTGTPSQLTRDGAGGLPTGISPDGAEVVFFKNFTDGRGPDLMVLDRTSPKAPRALLETPLEERDATISPDGRWMAYYSNISGEFQIYVRPFPNVNGGQWQISTDGGRWPLWSRSGQELFYVVPGQNATVHSVSVDTGNEAWKAGPARKLFECGCFTSGFGRSYDITPDDRRFLMIKQLATHDEGSAQIVVVRNWVEELKRIVN